MQLIVEEEGLRDVLRGLKKVDEDIYRDIRDELENAGKLVKNEGRKLFTPYDSFSAQGFVVRVRPLSRGSLVSVEQNLKKTTGQRPAWGALQMTEALIPARSKVMPDVITHLTGLVAKVIRQYGF